MKEYVSDGEWGMVGIQIPTEYRQYSIDELEEMLVTNRRYDIVVDPKTYDIWLKYNG